MLANMRTQFQYCKSICFSTTDYNISKQGFQRKYILTLNETLKLILLFSNILLFVPAIAILILAFYLWCANWGTYIDKSFFIYTGVILALISIILISTGYLGYIGIKNQTNVFGKEYYLKMKLINKIINKI